MSQEKSEEEGKVLDYDLMLAVINFTKATKHSLNLIRIESLYDLEEQVLRAKAEAMNKETKRDGVIKIEDLMEDLSENPI